MKIVRSGCSLPELQQPVVAALGKFDGLHLGHQALLQRVQMLAGGGTSVLVMLYPHPARVLQGVEIPRVQSLRQRVLLCRQIGIDVLYGIRFTKALSQLSAAEFLERYLISALNVRTLVVGQDAAVGKGRAGDTEFMREYLAGFGCNVEVLPFQLIADMKVGTREVVVALEQGDCELLKTLLGRYHSVVGRVVRGDQRGKLLGFATANLGFSPVVLPENGVYATFAVVEGRVFQGVTNIGVKPTFGLNKVSLETHLLDYCGEDFYGARMEVFFVQRLRGELKFSHIEQLQAQIKLDIETARALTLKNE